MSTNSLRHITGYLQVSEQLSTSGQPAAEDFATIAKLGYRSVINLALSTSDNAIGNEGDIITALGMNYVHIPVQWKHPRTEQFDLFAALMQQSAGQKVWVHCALNMRVSVFVYLYNTLVLGMAQEKAEQLMNAVWQPDAIWSAFISTVHATYAAAKAAGD